MESLSPRASGSRLNITIWGWRVDTVVLWTLLCPPLPWAPTFPLPLGLPEACVCPAESPWVLADCAGDGGWRRKPWSGVIFQILTDSLKKLFWSYPQHGEGPWPGLKPVPQQQQDRILNHQATRELLYVYFCSNTKLTWLISVSSKSWNQIVILATLFFPFQDHFDYSKSFEFPYEV